MYRVLVFSLPLVCFLFVFSVYFSQHLICNQVISFDKIALTIRSFALLYEGVLSLQRSFRLIGWVFSILKIQLGLHKSLVSPKLLS